MATEKITRSDAEAKGLKRFFTGEPCMRGHIAERQTTNGRCIICSKGTSRNYRSRNPEKTRALTRKYKETNPEWFKVQNAKYQRTRRARMRNGAHTEEDIQDLLRIQMEKCAICIEPLNGRFETDHIVPLGRGGDNNRSNIQLVCSPCNIRKGFKDPIEFMRSEGKLAR